MAQYMVEVQCVISTAVIVEADSPKDAAAQVNDYKFELPPESEWEKLDDCDFYVAPMEGDSVGDFEQVG